MEPEKYYSELLGINRPWETCRVKLKVGEQRLDIWIGYTDEEGPCPKCG